MRTSPSTITLALCLASSMLFACASDSDDDSDDNNPPNLTTNDASINASNSGLDASVASSASDGGIRDLLGDADIGSFFADGGLNNDAVCAAFPQACVDGAVVLPMRGDGGTFMRGDGGMFMRDGGRPMRDAASDGDGAASSNDAGGDAGEGGV